MLFALMCGFLFCKANKTYWTVYKRPILKRAHEQLKVDSSYYTGQSSFKENDAVYIAGDEKYLSRSRDD